MTTERRSDDAHCAGPVREHEAKVELRGDLARGAKANLALAVVRDASRIARLVVGEVARDVANVANDSGSGRRTTSTAPVVHRVVRHVALHVRSIERVVHVGEHVRKGNQRRMNANLDFVAVLRDAREELDAVAEVCGVLDVRAREVADAFDLNLVESRLEAVRESRENARLVGRVKAVDVERGIGLGVAELLRVLEDDVEGKPLVLHPREDVVAGAVENAVDRLDLVARETFAQDADDRDAAANRRAKVYVDVVLRRRLENLVTIFREQLLVRCDYALAAVERFKDKCLGDARAANCLDDDVDSGISEDAFRVCSENAVGDIDAAVRRDVEVRDLLQDDVDAEALRHDITMLQKAVSDSRANGSEAKNSNSYLLHVYPFSLSSLTLVAKSQNGMSSIAPASSGKSGSAGAGTGSVEEPSALRTSILRPVKSVKYLTWPWGFVHSRPSMAKRILAR